jgi:hypothetical protein
MKVWVQFELDEQEAVDNWAYNASDWNPETNEDEVDEDGVLDAFVEELEQLFHEGASFGPALAGVDVHNGLLDVRVATMTGQERTWKDSKFRQRRGY